MNTLLEAIQRYPTAFVDTLEVEIRNTNKEATKWDLQVLVSSIKSGSWCRVYDLLPREAYKRSLECAVYFLEAFSNVIHEHCLHIITLWKEGKLV